MPHICHKCVEFMMKISWKMHNKIEQKQNHTECFQCKFQYDFIKCEYWLDTF